MLFFQVGEYFQGMAVRKSKKSIAELMDIRPDYANISTSDMARFTKKIVWQNIIFALGIKAAFLVLGAFWVASMWEAVFADVGVALLAVLNAMRVMRVK